MRSLPSRVRLFRVAYDAGLSRVMLARPCRPERKILANDGFVSVVDAFMIVQDIGLMCKVEQMDLEGS